MPSVPVSVRPKKTDNQKSIIATLLLIIIGERYQISMQTITCKEETLFILSRVIPTYLLPTSEPFLQLRPLQHKR